MHTLSEDSIAATKVSSELFDRDTEAHTTGRPTSSQVLHTNKSDVISFRVVVRFKVQKMVLKSSGAILAIRGAISFHEALKVGRIIFLFAVGDRASRVSEQAVFGTKIKEPST